MNIGKAMKEIREERSLSSREMAALLGITPSALWRIENGKVWPKKATVDRFCFETKTPVARLYHLAFEPRDFAPIPSVQDVVDATRKSGAFTLDELKEYTRRLTQYSVNE